MYFIPAQVFSAPPPPQGPFFCWGISKKKKKKKSFFFLSYMILSSFPTTIYIFSDDYTERQREKEENNLILCCDNTSDLLAQVRTVTGFVLTYMFVVFHVRACVWVTLPVGQLSGSPIAQLRCGQFYFRVSVNSGLVSTKT